jgi:hypothetical protein
MNIAHKTAQLAIGANQALLANSILKNEVGSH